MRGSKIDASLHLMASHCILSSVAAAFAFFVTFFAPGSIEHCIAAAAGRPVEKMEPLKGADRRSDLPSEVKHGEAM